MTASPRTPREGDLLTRARRGDHAAFLELVAEHDRRLRALADRLLHDRRAMEDVLQRCYLTAYESVGQTRASRDPGAWLFRIAYNTCVDALRTRRRPAAAPAGATAGSDLPAAPDAAPEREDGVRGALAALPVAQRVALVLVDAEGFPEEVVAEILGVEPDKVASRLKRARSAVRKVLPVTSAERPSDAAIRGAVAQLPIPDHDPQFWAELTALLAPEASPAPAPPGQAAAPAQDVRDARDEDRAIPSARHLAVGPPSALVPRSLRRASNAVLLALAVVAAVVVIAAGLTLVRQRSDSGMGPDTRSLPVAHAVVAGVDSAPS